MTTMPAKDLVAAPERKAYLFDALSETGVLWLINRVVFHPRGYAMAIEYAEDGTTALGWSILGPGDEVHAFPYEDEQEKFEAVEALLAYAAEHGVAPPEGAGWPDRGEEPR